MKSAPSSTTESGRCGTDWEQSSSTSAPTSCARATIRAGSLIVPRMLDICTIDTSLVRSLTSSPSADSSSRPSSVTPNQRRVAPVVARAHEVGALVVLDSYQAAGILPFSVTDLDVDFCIGGSVKYLCGGPGNGWLYVASSVAASLRPADVGWFGHARPFDFAWSAIDYAPGVMRFAGGTPGVPAAYAAIPGYQAVLDVGLSRIRERSLSLTQPLLEGALERGFTVRSPHDPAVRGGHVTIDPGDSQRVHDELLARGFAVDHRPGVGIRVGPHFYNSADECTAILDEMVDILR